MTRKLIALSILSSALCATQAQAQTAPKREPLFSEFVYEALGATTSIRRGSAKAAPGKQPQAAQTSDRNDAGAKAKATNVAASRSASEHAPAPQR